MKKAKRYNTVRYCGVKYGFDLLDLKIDGRREEKMRIWSRVCSRLFDSYIKKKKKMDDGRKREKEGKKKLICSTFHTTFSGRYGCRHGKSMTLLRTILYEYTTINSFTRRSI